jgi:hypothetical protein
LSEARSTCAEQFRAAFEDSPASIDSSEGSVAAVHGRSAVGRALAILAGRVSKPHPPSAEDTVRMKIASAAADDLAGTDESDGDLLSDLSESSDHV